MKFLFLILAVSPITYATINSGSVDWDKVNRSSIQVLEERNRPKCEFNRGSYSNYHVCRNLEHNLCTNYGYLAQIHGRPSTDIRDRPLPNFETDLEEYTQMLLHTSTLVTPLYVEAKPYMARFVRSKGGRIGSTSRSIEKVELVTEGRVKFLAVEEEAARRLLPPNSPPRIVMGEEGTTGNTTGTALGISGNLGFMQGMAVLNYANEISAHPKKFTPKEREWSKIFLNAAFRIGSYNQICSGNSRNAFMVRGINSPQESIVKLNLDPSVSICNREILTAATRTNDPKRALTFIMFHELAHNSDSSDDPRISKFEQCLEEKQFRTHQEFSTQRKDLVADRLAIDAMAEYMEDNGIKGEQKVLSFLKDNYQILCGAGESNTHPSGEFRMNNLLMRTPKIRQLLGCVDEKPVEHCEL